MSVLKRGKTDDYEYVRQTLRKRTNTELEAGDELKEFLIDEFLTGDLNNTQIARIAELHQRSGGCGLDPLSAASTCNRRRSVAKKYVEDVIQPLRGEFQRLCKAWPLKGISIILL